MSAPSSELLGRLLDRHQAALSLYARQWCRSPDDVVQEAFVQLARQAACPDDPTAWLYRVVRNGAISACRSESRRRKHESAAADAARLWFEDSPASAMDSKIAAAALAQLPVEQREVLVAHVWGGLTFAQIAAIDGASASSAHRRYQAGLAALRNLLGEPCLINDQKKNCP